ncbi:MAG TPA: hypothetical protein VK255_03885 [Patescibacteria group bacterium]|nr:hypothetical protein [Patescibacteria group bacterium]
MKINKNIFFSFRGDQDISSPLAFSFILVFGFAIVYYLTLVAEKIVVESKNSPSFNIEKRVDNYIK